MLFFGFGFGPGFFLEVCGLSLSFSSLFFFLFSLSSWLLKDYNTLMSLSNSIFFFFKFSINCYIFYFQLTQHRVLLINWVSKPKHVFQRSLLLSADRDGSQRRAYSGSLKWRTSSRDTKLDNRETRKSCPGFGGEPGTRCLTPNVGKISSMPIQVQKSKQNTYRLQQGYRDQPTVTVLLFLLSLFLSNCEVLRKSTTSDSDAFTVFRISERQLPMSIAGGCVFILSRMLKSW